MPDEFATGYRRAVPVDQILVLDPVARRSALEAAVADPAREWRVEEFDGRRYVPVATVRGPAARAAWLRGDQAASPASAAQARDLSSREAAR